MKLTKITDSNGRYFWGVLTCEFCGHEAELKNGYDHANYHNRVIPQRACYNCGKASTDMYRPLMNVIEEMSAKEFGVPYGPAYDDGFNDGKIAFARELLARATGQKPAKD